VLNFRAQVGTQIERITAQQREEAELASRPPPPPPTRLHPVEEAEPAG